MQSASPSDARALARHVAHDALLRFAVEQSTATAQHRHGKDQQRRAVMPGGHHHGQVAEGDDGQPQGQYLVGTQPRGQASAYLRQH